MSELADSWGIVPGYFDNYGTWRVTPASTRDALLSAMGLDGAAPQSAEVPAVRVLRGAQELPLPAPAELRLEDGTSLRLRDSVPGDVPWGYHELQWGDGSSLLLIKSPPACFLPPGLRTWGWAVQLYATRSVRSWGFGDLSDLRQLARWSRGLGAGVLLVNPLHAAAPTLPQQASPYFPTSRRFRNPLYLSVADVPGAAEAADAWAPFEAEARSLNANRRLDRDRVLPLKLQALQLLWQRFPGSEAFDRYCLEQGQSLVTFAAYCVLAGQLGPDWRRWPEAFRRPDSPDVQRFSDQQRPQVRFQMWLQWLLDQQLATAAQELPLVQDLPIGADPGGADAWEWQDVLAQGVTIGAPPDQFNTDGQNWALPPFIPHRLRAARFRPFIETVRASLRHAGGLRIDHVMGMFRLFWIPQGLDPSQGTYVRYPAEEMLAIVAVESHRAGAWIAGEDLGTVEPHVRQQLFENHMLTYRLLWFEDALPSHYPELALAAVSTHDLPTVAGMWTRADFAAQQRIGLRPGREDFERVRERLRAVGSLADSDSAAEAVRRAYAALAAAPSAVLAASLDDALAVEERPNMPGTVTQWPNWCLALPKTLDDLPHDPLAQSLAESLRR